MQVLFQMISLVEEECAIFTDICDHTKINWRNDSIKAKAIKISMQMNTDTVLNNIQ